MSTEHDESDPDVTLKTGNLRVAPGSGDPGATDEKRLTTDLYVKPGGGIELRHRATEPETEVITAIVKAQYAPEELRDLRDAIDGALDSVER